MSRLAVYVGTTNDTSGNPRRGWIIFDGDGHHEGFVDEGYEGGGALKGYPGIRRTHYRIQITPAEYRALNKRRTNKNRRRTSRRR